MWTPMSNEMFNCVGMITLITNKAELLLPVTASVPSNTCQIELFICKEITSTMNADKNTLNIFIDILYPASVKQKRRVVIYTGRYHSIRATCVVKF